MKIFYHNDMDGRCAGYWVIKETDTTENKEAIAINYNKPFPLDIIEPGEEVYIVDYSIEPAEMKSLLDKTSHVTWIDHHISAIEKYKDFDSNIRGVRVNGIAGCVLTWVYLHKMTDRGQGEIIPFDKRMLVSTPLFTELIGDRDVWAWKHKDLTKHFHAGAQIYNTHPQSHDWEIFCNSPWAVIEQGEIVERYRKKWHEEIASDFAFPVKFEGHDCIAINQGRTSSQLFDSIKEDIKEKFDIYITFVYDGNKYTYSLYTEKPGINVSQIAIKYGGGGHQKAAGFTSSKFILK